MSDQFLDEYRELQEFAESQNFPIPVLRQPNTDIRLPLPVVEQPEQPIVEAQQFPDLNGNADDDDDVFEAEPFADPAPVQGRAKYWAKTLVYVFGWYITLDFLHYYMCHHDRDPMTRWHFVVGLLAKIRTFLCTIQICISQDLHIIAPDFHFAQPIPRVAKAVLDGIVFVALALMVWDWICTVFGAFDESLKIIIFIQLVTLLQKIVYIVINVFILVEMQLQFYLANAFLCTFYSIKLLDWLIRISSLPSDGLLICFAAAHVFVGATPLYEKLNIHEEVVFVMKRWFPWYRYRLWTATQNATRVQRLRAHYNANKDLIEKTECPVCWDVCQNSVIWFPCLHHTCSDCGRDSHFRHEHSKCPVCRTVIEESVEVEGKPFTAQFRVGRQMKDWVINWCSGDGAAVGN